MSISSVTAIRLPFLVGIEKFPWVRTRRPDVCALHVNQILCILADKRLRPLYFHCSFGRDRTSLMATLYELHYLGLPAQDAWEEMKRFGFKDDWTLRGLKAYL